MTVFDPKINFTRQVQNVDLTYFFPKLHLKIIEIFTKNRNSKSAFLCLKNLVGSIFFEQLVTLVMFFSGFFDVKNHVSIMRKSLISIFFSAGPICQPVTGAASIEKKIFY